MQNCINSRRRRLPIQAPVLTEVARKVALTGRRSSPLRRRVPGQEEDLVAQDQIYFEANVFTGHLAVLGVRELGTIRREVLGNVLKRPPSKWPGCDLLKCIFIQDLGEGALNHLC